MVVGKVEGSELGRKSSLDTPKGSKVGKSFPEKKLAIGIYKCIVLVQ
jgi:hypothetical protein